MLSLAFTVTYTYRHYLFIYILHTGAETGTFKPSKNNAAGVNYISYQDVSVCILEALDQKEDFNRSMMGVAPK